MIELALIFAVWLVDAGYAQHLVPDVALLTNVTHEKRPFQMAYGTIWSSHRGKCKADKLVLHCIKPTMLTALNLLYKLYFFQGLPSYGPELMTLLSVPRASLARLDRC